jgi:hypothetical protein
LPTHKSFSAANDVVQRDSADTNKKAKAQMNLARHRIEKPSEVSKSYLDCQLAQNRPGKFFSLRLYGFCARNSFGWASTKKYTAKAFGANAEQKLCQKKSQCSANLEQRLS